MDTCDAIIIGSGQAGNPLAVKFAVSGKTVALIEKEHIGGSCVNVGCSPTKTMEASGRIAHLVQRAGDHGIMMQGPVSVNMEPDPEIVDGMARHLGGRRDLQPLDMVDITRYWLLEDRSGNGKDQVP